MIYKRKLLEDSEVDRLRALLANNGWEDGLVSTTNMTKELKSNLESLISGPSRVEANNIIFGGLDRDRLFLRKTAAKDTHIPIFSKTSTGGFYRSHQDEDNIGDFSTTVFLNDPSEYDGGVLRLYDGSEIVDVKLDAGWAVTYSTGTPHEVSEVTRGDRMVSILWTHSLLNTHRDSSIYENISILKSIFDHKNHASLEDAMQDPRFLLDCLARDLTALIEKKSK